METTEKKVLKALVEIEKTVEKLDDTLDKLDGAEGKVKYFVEQEKAIHAIKKIVREWNKIEKYEEKDEEKWARKIAVDMNEQEKALDHIAKAAGKLEEELSKVSDDDGKVKSYIAQKRAAHQIKKILHNCGLYEKYVEDEIENLS